MSSFYIEVKEDNIRIPAFSNVLIMFSLFDFNPLTRAFLIESRPASQIPGMGGLLEPYDALRRCAFRFDTGANVPSSLGIRCGATMDGRLAVLVAESREPLWYAGARDGLTGSMGETGDK